MFDFIAQATEPVITGLDVVKTVDAFYQNAWLMLVGLLALFGTLVVVVMPLIMQRIQSSSFDKTEKRLKNEIEQIKNETQESMQGEVESLRSTFDEIQKNMEKQIDKRARANRAEFYSQMAINFSLDPNEKYSTFSFCITAATEFASLKKYKSLTRVLNRAISVSAEGFPILSVTSTSTAEAIAVSTEIQTMVLEEFAELCKILEEQGVKERFSEQLAKIDEICKNLLIVADKPEPPEKPKQK